MSQIHYIPSSKKTRGGNSQTIDLKDGVSWRVLTEMLGEITDWQTFPLAEFAERVGYSPSNAPSTSRRRITAFGDAGLLEEQRPRHHGMLTIRYTAHGMGDAIRYGNPPANGTVVRQSPVPLGAFDFPPPAVAGKNGTVQAKVVTDVKTLTLEPWTCAYTVDLTLDGHLTLDSVDEIIEKIREVGSADAAGRKVRVRLESTSLWNLRGAVDELHQVMLAMDVYFQVEDGSYTERTDPLTALLEEADDEEALVIERVAADAGLLWICPIKAWTNRKGQLCGECRRSEEDAFALAATESAQAAAMVAEAEAVRTHE